MRAVRPADPFRTLGLRADAEITDDEVRAAWRRIATATHPDRADGGDPERFAQAAAAYTELRTAFGRGEARAELSAGARPRAAAQRGWPWAPLASRIKAGRPARLLLRLAVAVAVGTTGVLAAGPGSAAAPALAVGALTWLLVTVPADLAPGGRRGRLAGQCRPARAAGVRRR